MMSSKYCRSSSGLAKSGAGQSWSGIRLFHNLMNALAAEVVRIRDLAERHSLAAHLQNFRISVMVRRRPWLQWAPGPAWKILKNLNFPGRNLALLAALSDVADPRADVDLSPINNFHVNGRDSGVTGALRELPKGSDIKLESGVVVHGWHYRTYLFYVRECPSI